MALLKTNSTNPLSTFYEMLRSNVTSYTHTTITTAKIKIEWHTNVRVVTQSNIHLWSYHSFFQYERFRDINEEVELG